MATMQATATTVDTAATVTITALLAMALMDMGRAATATTPPRALPQTPRRPTATTEVMESTP